MVKKEVPSDPIRAVGFSSTMIGFALSGSIWASSGFQHPLSLGIALLLFISGLVCFTRTRYRRRWARVEQRRQEAAQRASDVTLYTQQPLPRERALQLPISIKLEPTWLIVLACFIFMTVFVGVIATGLSLVLGDVFHLEQASWLFILIISIACAVPGSLLVLLGGHQRVTATESGLTVWTPGETRTIHWEEAHLFAVSPGAGRLGHPTRYELSSATAILRWTRFHQENPFFQSKLPFEEYDRQMEALLSVIAAKTGLPLYDLR